MQNFTKQFSPSILIVYAMRPYESCFVKLYKTICGYYFQGKLKKPCEYPQGQNKLK